MAHPLLEKWREWSGTAEETAAEADAYLAGNRLDSEGISLRTFQNYVQKRVVTPADQRSGYKRRQLLEAIAVKKLIAEKWPLDKTTNLLKGLDEDGLAQLIEPLAPESNPAKDLAERLMGRYGMDVAPVRARMAVASPALPPDVFKGSAVPFAAALAAGALPDHSAPAMEAESRLSFRVAGIEVSADPSNAKAMGEVRFTQAALAAIEAARQVIFGKSK